MEHPAEFNVVPAIEDYLDKINEQQLLDRDEWEELFDHLFLQTEELTQIGLKPEEAFAVSKMRFGDTAVIRKEYEQVKPFGRVRKTLFSGLICFFWIVTIVSITNLCSIVSFYGGTFLDLSSVHIRYLDLGIKILFICASVTYFLYRISRQIAFKKWEVILIPIFGIFFPFGTDRLLIGLASIYFSIEEFRMISEFVVINSMVLYFIIMIALILSTYILYHKERKQIAVN